MNEDSDLGVTKAMGDGDKDDDEDGDSVRCFWCSFGLYVTNDDVEGDRDVWVDDDEELIADEVLVCDSLKTELVFCC